jgi:molybdate transport system substrate-binding protein
LRKILAPALLATTVAAAAGAAASEVRIFAASSLTDSLGEVLSLFERERPGVRVVSQFGGSNDLVRQILAGAPADLFFSADERQMDRLQQAGFVESRKDVLSNRLVLVQPISSAWALRSLADLRMAARIAMADPEAVPAGVYAREYLTGLGIWEEVRPRVVPTLDVRGALAAVAASNVDAAFVYRTDARIDPRVRVAFEVPREEGPRIVYPLALIRGRAGGGAEALFRFLSATEAGAVFDRHGFLVLGGVP